MHKYPLASNSETAIKARSVLFVLLGVAVLLLKQRYAGPLDEVVHAYAGNLSISFALYFLFTNLRFPTGIRRVASALIAFTAVELFELSDGFGVMPNTYDPIDLLVNPIGIALGFWLDSKPGTVKTQETKTNSS